MAREVIRYDNSFIEAVYSMGLLEKKILIGISYRAQKQNFEKFGCEVEFHVSEIADLVGIGKDSFRHVDKALKNLMSTVITAKDPECPEEHFIHFVTIFDAEYDHGTIKLRVSERLRPFLKELRKRFTEYHLLNIRPLRSEYSIRMYELIKRYENLTYKEFPLDELRNLLGTRFYNDKGKLVKEIFPKYANFKERVLEKARKDLEKECDTYFSYAEVKKGHAVDRIKVFIHKKSKDTAETGGQPDLFGNFDNEYFELEMEIRRYNWTGDFKHLVDKAGGMEALGWYWENVLKEKLKSPTIQNQGGFINKDVEENCWKAYQAFNISQEKEKKFLEDAVRKYETETPQEKFVFEFMRFIDTTDGENKEFLLKNFKTDIPLSKWGVKVKTDFLKHKGLL